MGQTKIVGGDKMPGGPVTLRLENVPERQALDVLLRAASGFMVAERPEPVATLARFDRIMILPTSSAPTGGQAAAPGPGGRGGGMNLPSPTMAPVAPQPVADEPAEATIEPDNGDQSNDADGRPPETNFDYANPQQFLQKRLEQLQQQQSQGQQAPIPTMFPGTMSPYGTVGHADRDRPDGRRRVGRSRDERAPGRDRQAPGAAADDGESLRHPGDAGRAGAAADAARPGQVREPVPARPRRRPTDDRRAA